MTKSAKMFVVFMNLLSLHVLGGLVDGDLCG